MSETCNPMRAGESWTAFLKRYRITDVHEMDGGWRVVSESGHTYVVRSQTRIDRESGSMYFVMTCDCPARKRCRHIDAVEQMRYAEELAAAQAGDTDGMEILERTI